MKALADSVRVNRRFSRSINVERDHGREAIQGYLPTGRALDVVTRVAQGFADASAGRAFSITGPHGGGKSSLAVFLDALLAPRDSDEYHSASSLLESIDPSTWSRVEGGLHSLDPSGNGFIRAFVTAQREPVTHTLARALFLAAQRDVGRDQRYVPETFLESAASPDPKAVLAAVNALTAEKPLVVVIDEFGKNLESYMDSGRDGDLYLLQQLAECGQGSDPLPFTILTMQHLSFDEYVQDSSAQRRREWAKIQGRFQDIPYVETAAQSRRLISAALEVSDPALSRRVEKWASTNAEQFTSIGLREVIQEAAGAYPLDPIVLAVLPELCSRYGQNERTLFSFLGGPEPFAVPKFLEESHWDARSAPPFVGLNRVYDYFVESAGTSVGASSSASRWLEIENRIRDASGVTPEERIALKVIGVLNLVSTSGLTRASQGLVVAALSAALPKTSNGEKFELLQALQDKGLITYREYSDEYRIWQGSDYDLRASVELAKAAYRNRGLAQLLQEAVALDPQVAGRSSQKHGTLRLFERRFSDLLESPTLAAPDSPWDGVLLLATTTEEPTKRPLDEASGPVVIAVPSNLEGLYEAALETCSLQAALQLATSDSADWVARRELTERLAVAKQQLTDLCVSRWGTGNVRWYLANTDEWLPDHLTTSGAVSAATELVFFQTPTLANEMLAKRELTSQGAKARRRLIEAMLVHPHDEAFGLQGYGPERAMYEALFRAPGLHRMVRGEWRLDSPTEERWASAWRALSQEIDSSHVSRRPLPEIAGVLKRPPIGLKDGVLPVLLIAALMTRESDVALYEHGSLVMRLDDAVAERLVRNPGHFSVKNLATSGGARKAVVESLSRALIVKEQGTAPTFLQVARAIFRTLRELPPYSQSTRRGLSPQALAVREVFQTAVEPDVLFFRDLPIALELKEFAPTARADVARAEEFAARLTDALLELTSVYPDLLVSVTHRLADATASTTRDLAELQRRLVGQAVNLQDHVLDPRLKSFLGALARDQMSPESWLVNVAMVTVDGHAPRTWTDELQDRFSLQVAELGGALRRTQALLYERVASGTNALEMRRVTVTSPDGSEEVETVALTDAERELLESTLSEALGVLEAAFGSGTAARRSLLAWLVLNPDESQGSKVTSPPRAKGDVAQ